MKHRALLVAASITFAALHPLNAGAETPTPPPSGVIRDLAFNPEVQIVRPDGSFIPLDERVWTAVVTWRSEPGSAAFEIFGRDRRDGPLELRGSVSGPGPEFRFEEKAGFFELPLCYVVRLGANEAEVCRPEPPSSGGAPPPAGTPWPAPSGIRTTNSYEGSPPTTVVEFSWDVLPGFTGTFEIQRAETRVEKYRPVESEWVAVAMVPASAAVGGRMSFSDRVAFEVAVERPACYRVRAVSGSETGPWSSGPVYPCSVLPPGAERAATPQAPDTGTSTSTGAGRNLAPAVAVAAVFLLLGSVFLGLRPRAGRRR